MNYNNMIIALVVILAVVIVAGAALMFNASKPAMDNVAPNNTSSSSVDVEQVTTEDVKSQSGGSTHIVMGEDGYYFVVDDNGKILQNLGPSKKYYPNGDNGQPSVDYPDAEPYSRYLPNGKQ